MNGKEKRNNQPSVDLITHYFNNEVDHIPLLIGFLKNEKQLNENTLFSNLFNFKVNFERNEVIIEDECRLFLASNPEGVTKIAIDKLLVLCRKKIDK